MYIYLFIYSNATRCCLGLEWESEIASKLFYKQNIEGEN